MWQLSPLCPWEQGAGHFHPEKSGINTPAAPTLAYLEYVFNSQPYTDHQMVTESHHLTCLFFIDSCFLLYSSQRHWCHELPNSIRCLGSTPKGWETWQIQQQIAAWWFEVMRDATSSKVQTFLFTIESNTVLLLQVESRPPRSWMDSCQRKCQWTSRQVLRWHLGNRKWCQCCL